MGRDLAKCLCAYIIRYIICYSAITVRAVIFLRQILLLPERSKTHEVEDEMQFTVDTL